MIARLSSLALILLLALPGMTVAGSSVSGVWTLEESPILITEDIYVPEGGVLEVEAGVIVLMPDGGKLTVLGELQCLGTPKNPIIFEPSDGLSIWEGIEIQGNDEGLASQFLYTQIKNARVGVALSGGIATMMECVVDAIDVGISMVGGSQGQFRACRLETLSDQSNAYGIYARESHLELDDSTVRMRVLQESGASPGSGIYMYHGSGYVDSTDVSVISASGASGVSLLGCASDVGLENSSIYVQRTGFDPFQFAAAVQAFDSDLTLNRMSIHLRADQGDLFGVQVTLNGDVNIQNSIIAAPEAGQGFNIQAVFVDTFDPTSSVNMEYSCYYRMQLANTNTNFEFDDETVFAANPRWANSSEQDYHLLEDSPCINNGDPNDHLDPDGTVADIGRHHFHSTSAPEPVEPGVLPASAQLHAAYPNPFNHGTRVQLELPQAANVHVRIVDTLGRQVATLASGQFAAGSHPLTWLPSEQMTASGMYLLHARVDGVVHTQRLVYVK